jgi:NADH dehydrogenase
MSNKTKILILGGGFGGVYAALRLDKTLARRTDVEVTLVSSDNFLLFTPMLHEVASGDLNPSDIVNPIRRMLKRVQFVQADVRSIDLAAKRVHCTRGLRPVPLDLDYDHLVLALGSETNFFGMLKMIFSKDLEQMLTLRDVELISRIATSLRSASPREIYEEVERCREER